MNKESVSMDSAAALECMLATESTAEVGNESFTKIPGQRELNEKSLRNLSTHQLSDDQVNVLSRALKFIPTPVTNKTIIRRKLLRDFEQFARRMRLHYISFGCHPVASLVFPILSYSARA